MWSVHLYVFVCWSMKHMALPLVGRKAAYMILSKYVVQLGTNSGCKSAMSFVNLTVCCELSCGLQHMVCMNKPYASLLQPGGQSVRT